MSGKAIADPQTEKFRREADELLFRISEQEHLLKVKEIRAQIRIDDIKKELQDAKAGINEKVKKLKKKLKELAAAEHKRTRLPSYLLTFGEITFRLRTELKPLKGFKWESIKELLKEKDLIKFLRVKYEVNKDAIKSANLTDEQLTDLGMKLVPSRPFDCALNREAFEKSRTSKPAA